MNKSFIVEELITYYCDGNKSKFAQMLGVAPSTVCSWIKRNTFDAQLIVAKCASVNPSYLVTGEGPMLLSDDIKNEKKEETGKENNNEYNVKINEMLSVAHTLQELFERNMAILEKSQQQFDRVLDMYERMNMNGSTYNSSTYHPQSDIIHASEDAKKVTDEDTEDNK